MQTVLVVIVEVAGDLLGPSLSEDEAFTLIAVASDDPTCWDDVVAYWPRYRTPSVPDLAESLAFKRVERAVARRELDRHGSWVVIDLGRKRILTGSEIQPICRDQVFATAGEESGGQRWPLSIHLPPWWEMVERVDPTAIDRDRETPLSVRRVDREVLFGGALIEDLARRILDVIDSAEWRESGASEQDAGRYDFTLRVHRDWLMTPRGDLAGLMPRQMLHGAVGWLDRVEGAQQKRFADGEKIVAVPIGVTGYDEAPMGREEVVMYFDMCRELIAAGWDWCIAQGIEWQDVADHPRRENELVAFLSSVKDEWLMSPLEGGAAPQFIIECSRRRVPRGLGVEIDGMTERQPVRHASDCECPVCDMIGDGMFGTAFEVIDGHHLELDEEFAFSLLETREEWEEQQREIAEFSADFDSEHAYRQFHGEMEPDPFGSAWSGHISDEPLPGDSHGHLKLAFLLAEMVGLLQSVGAPRGETQELNESFRAFRACDRRKVAACATHLKDQLEAIARRHPDLVSHVADLQSRIDEQIRSPGYDNELLF